MPDRENVIYDIERCICHVPDACRDCSHYGHGEAYECMEELLTDAHALLKEDCHNCKLECLLLKYDQLKEKYDTLLKEQEAVKPKIDAFGHPYCPKCKILVYETWEFCPHCGQAVK